MMSECAAVKSPFSNSNWNIFFSGKNWTGSSACWHSTSTTQKTSKCPWPAEKWKSSNDSRSNFSDCIFFQRRWFLFLTLFDTPVLRQFTARKFKTARPSPFSSEKKEASFVTFSFFPGHIKNSYQLKNPAPVIYSLVLATTSFDVFKL